MDTDFLRKEFFLQPVGSSNSVNVLAYKVIDAILVVAGALAIIYFIYSGILYLTSAGNPDNIKKAQQGLMYAAIGIAIVVVSNYVLTTIADFAKI